MVELPNMNKKIIRTIAYILVTALLLSCLTGCETWDNFYKAFFGGDEEETPVVKIAIFEPLTGTDAKAAADEVAGIELAHERFGSVLDMEVQLVYADTKSDIEEAKLVAQKLVDDDTSIVLGSYGNTITIAAGDIFKEGKLPAIAITCSNPLITRTNPYYARVCHQDTDEAIAAADFTNRFFSEGHSVVAIYERINEYSKAKAEAYSAHLAELSGKEYIPVTAFDPTSTDFQTLFSTFVINGNDTIFLPDPAEVSKVVIDKAKELGYEFTWIGTSYWDDTDIDNVYYTADFAAGEAQTAITTYFNEAYAKKFGTDKAPSEAAALGFDAYLLALAAIREADSAEDGELIASKLITIKGLAGATGSITMNEYGDPVKQIIVNYVHNGVKNTVYTVAPE